MRTYTDHNTTPLAFHKLFLWLWIPLGMLVEIYNLYSDLSDYSMYALVYADALYIYFFEVIVLVISIILRIVIFCGLRKWKPYSWFAIHIKNIMLIIYSFFFIAFFYYYDILNIGEDFSLFSNIILSALVSLYYWKRKSLFFQNAEPTENKTNPEIISNSKLETKAKPEMTFVESDEITTFDNQISLDDLQAPPTSTNTEILPTLKQGKKSKKILPFVCLVCLMCSLIGNINLYYSNSKLIKENNRALSDAKYWKNKYDIEENQSKKLISENNEMRYEYNFYHNHAAIVTEYGYRYHHYDCYHLDDADSFWIYNTEAAKSQGYTPCKDCWN